MEGHSSPQSPSPMIHKKSYIIIEEISTETDE